MIHKRRPWKLPDFQYPHPPCPSTSNIFHPLDLERPISNNPPLQIITNQLKQNIIQRGLLLCYQVLPSGRLSFSNSINLIWLSFDFFSFSWSLTILQSTCFICRTWKCKRTMEQQPHRACERTKSKQEQNQVTSHSNWPRILLFHLAHKQCTG